MKTYPVLPLRNTVLFPNQIIPIYIGRKQSLNLVNDVSKIEDKKTLVIYNWNGDMRGDFPQWAYTKAWTKQGNEIILNLKEEVKRRNNLND